MFRNRADIASRLTWPRVIDTFDNFYSMEMGMDQWTTQFTLARVTGQTFNLDSAVDRLLHMEMSSLVERYRHLSAH